MDKNKVLQIIADSFPEEYDFIGKSNVVNLIETVAQNKELELDKSKSGDWIDWTESINMMFGLIQVIAAIIQIIEYRKQKKLQINKENIKSDLKDEVKPETLDLVELEDYDKLISEILKKESDE